MLTVQNLSMSFGGTPLFKNVELMFSEGNCYGIIGANGAGKSTFLKILSGKLEPSSGEIVYNPKLRMSVLEQDHFAYEEQTVLDTILQGNKRLWDIMVEKDALYAKPDFSDEDGERAGHLESEFAEMNGWESETEVAKLVNGLLIGCDLYDLMSTLSESQKVRVLLCRALFGHPDIILLDEPTNGLTIENVTWLEDFLADYDGTVIVVSHDRYFLNDVCTHIVDIDFGKIKMYVGNYDFWYESSQLVQRLMREQNKKNEDKIKELQSFIARFSANKSKSRQATSRRKLLDKLTVEEMPASSRRYPYAGFQFDKELGKDILHVDKLSATLDGEHLFSDVSFRANKGDKIVIYSENEHRSTALFELITGEKEIEEGKFIWGKTVTYAYFPKDNTSLFADTSLNLLEWLAQFSDDTHETYLRGFLGKMLFSGDEVLKSASVCSGGEKVRLMLSAMMMKRANVLILDDPTNHLDLESITALNNGLIDYKGVILFTSHDHQFVETVANRVIELRDFGVFDKACEFDEYLSIHRPKLLETVKN